MRFDEFSVGDYVSFSRRFGKSDFLAFRRLSGDSNPLHHDHAYGARSEFGRTIVPLHLVAAPLSAVAGMHFPGDPSLYLGHELRALLPVHYGETLAYSARVVAINSGLRALTLSVVVLRDAEIVVEGQMRVQARVDEWLTPPEYMRRGLPHALVTGASGAIGGAIALELARRGWRLWLHARGPCPALDAVVAECRALGSDANPIVANLERPADRSGMVRRLMQDDAPPFLVHAASPGLDSGLDRLVAVNYRALKALADAMLPRLLRRQAGGVLMIGSTALRHHPAGWDDYIAAKAMSAAYVEGISSRYARYGVEGLMLFPGFVRTGFSAKWRKEATPALLPEQVADVAAEMLAEAPVERRGNCVWVEPGRTEFGNWGFQPQGVVRSGSEKSSDHEPGAVRAGVSGAAAFEATARRLLKLPANLPLAGGGLGRTPGWDSLRHIELLLGLEHAYGIKFSSGEIEHARDFEGLANLWMQKVSP
jgi:NAD(P)-dependent dehydrogenase (short-subunit alcohol dehydrogenase family)/acyl dehydratase